MGFPGQQTENCTSLLYWQVKGHVCVLLRVINYKEQTPLQKQATAFCKGQGNVLHSSENMEEPEEGKGERLEKGNAEDHRVGWGIIGSMRNNREKIQQIYRKNLQEELDQGGHSLASMI